MMRLLGSLLSGRGTSILLSLVFIGLSIYYGVCFELQGRVDRELLRLSQQHERVRLAEFRVPNVPEEQNAAPYYMAAIELCSNSALDGLLYHNGTDRPSMDRALSDHRADIHRILSDREEAFTLLAEGYRQPLCVYKFDATQGFHLRLPNFLAVRDLCSRVYLQSTLDLQQGHVQAAIDREAHLMAFIGRFAYGQELIVEMIKIAGGHIGLNALEAMADQGVRGDYTSLLEQLDQLEVNMRPALARGLEGERALDLDVFDSVNSSGQLEDAVGHEEEAYWSLPAYRWAGRPLHLLDELYLLSVYDRLFAALSQDKPEMLRVPAQTIPSCYLVSHTFISNYLDHAYENHHKFLVRLQQVRDRLSALNTH